MILPMGLISKLSWEVSAKGFIIRYSKVGDVFGNGFDHKVWDVCVNWCSLD